MDSFFRNIGDHQVNQGQKKKSRELKGRKK